MTRRCRLREADSIPRTVDMTATSEWKLQLFLICGVLTALTHGVWYNITPSDAVSVDLGLEVEPLTCEKMDSDLFITSGHHDNPGLDQAVLVVTSMVERKLVLCGQSDVCHKCALLELITLHKSENKTILVNSAYPVSLRVSENATGEVLCRLNVKLGEHGRYELHISTTHGSDVMCNMSTQDQPTDSNIPIYIALSVFVGTAGLWILLKFMYRKGWLYRVAFCMPTERLVNSDLGTPGSVVSDESGANANSPAIVPTKPRLRSLDTFRGLSLVVMIFVNYAGGHYWFFRHSAWDGLTVADLVFPWFVFIMGTSIAIAFKSQLRRGVPRKKLLLKVIRRSLILFALGLVLSNRAKKGREVSLSSLRIPGVLQRLSFSYLVVALMEVCFAQGADVHQHKWWASVRDITPFWPEWLVSLGLLVVHVCLTLLLPVSGCPTGYLGPGGLHDNRSHDNCTGGAAGYIDSWFFGSSHIYQHPTTKVTYLSSLPHDPEGILGSLTSVFLCFLGLQAGKILVYHQDWIRRIKRWVIWGVLTGLTAGALCRFSQYDGWIPVNKNLWSVSYVLAMASMAYLLLCLCYLLVDVTNIWSGAPFFYTGMNSIVIYMCSEVFSIYFPVQFVVKDTHAAQLAMALWGATVWSILAAILYHKKIFVAI